jgi:hypothetical protein
MFILSASKTLHYIIIRYGKICRTQQKVIYWYKGQPVSTQPWGYHQGREYPCANYIYIYIYIYGAPSTDRNLKSYIYIYIYIYMDVIFPGDFAS